MEKNTILNKEVEQHNFNKGGEVSSKLKTILTRLGIDPDIIRRSSIVSYELEMNIIIHSQGGQITVEIDEQEIVIHARDQGPGIKDIDRALKPGFSTAAKEVREMGFGAGMGLNNVQKYSDNLKIESEINRGTRVETMINL
ncbi:MAG: ATP-binding protein [Halanaerobiaceae bacterium]